MVLDDTPLTDPPQIDSPSYEDKVIPKLVQPDSGLTYEPDVVTKLGGTLPWESNSEQLQCGETVTSNNGDTNIRMNMESVAPKSEFEKLQRMRAQSATIKLVSAAYTGKATFDQLKFNRVPDANGAITLDGLDEEPRYMVQLQSKEEGEQGIFGN